MTRGDHYTHSQRVGRFEFMIYGVIGFIAFLVLLILIVLIEDYRRVRQPHYDPDAATLTRASGLCPKCNGNLTYRNGLPSCVTCGQMWWRV